MLSGLIVYAEADHERNAWFISSCINNLASNGVSLIYQNEDDVLNYVKKNKVDFVIYRARNYQILQELEYQGIRCFNSALTNKVANNKYLTYQFLLKQNVRCLSSFLSINELDEYPLIMKSVDGHGGQEVYLIQNENEVETFKKPGKEYVYQPFYKNGGDLRLFVLNKKVIGAVLRHNNTDFRSNFSLGGQIEPFEASDELKVTAEQIATILDADYIGVDFLKVDDKWLVNEIEDPVGARMLFKASGIDASKLFCDYIYRALTEK